MRSVMWPVTDRTTAPVVTWRMRLLKVRRKPTIEAMEIVTESDGGDAATEAPDRTSDRRQDMLCRANEIRREWEAAEGAAKSDRDDQRAKRRNY
jgi:hypothetical protein